MQFAGLIPISTYRLFGEYTIVPPFIKHLGLAPIYDRFYGEISKLINHPLNRDQGYVLISREKIAELIVCSLRAVDRIIATCKRLNLMIICSTGRGLLISLCYHEGMGISEDQIRDHQIKLSFGLPKKAIQIRQQRQNTIALKEDHDPEEPKNAAAAPVPQPPPYNQTTSEAEQPPPSPTTIQKAKSSPTMPEAKSRFSFEQVLAYAQSEQRLNGTIYNLGAFVYMRWMDGRDDLFIEQFFNQSKPLDSCQKNTNTAPMSKQSPPKSSSDEYKPRLSRYDEEVCLEFAQAQRASGREIFSVGGLADWLSETGKQDKQISKWLKDRADSLVGQCREARPSNSVGQDSKAETSSPGTNFQDFQAELMRKDLLEKKRESAFNTLDADTREGLIEKKLKDFDKRGGYQHMFKEQRIEQAIWEIKKDLLPDPDAKI